jgi:hypothetical protein
VGQHPCSFSKLFQERFLFLRLFHWKCSTALSKGRPISLGNHIRRFLNLDLFAAKKKYLNMTLLRLLYLPISLCYFLWAIPSPADSLLPSPGHVNSQGNPGLRADLDLYEWLHMVTRGGDESTGHNNPHQFDSDQMGRLNSDSLIISTTAICQR